MALQGRCACGTITFEVSEPFRTAGYCHCKRCQRRSGALWTVNAQVAAAGLTIIRGAEAVRWWRPESGFPKGFCAHCGSQVLADAGEIMIVRLGAIDGDPGVRPEWHQWLDSAPDWEAIPDDGLPRFAQQRPPG